MLVYDLEMIISESDIVHLKIAHRFFAFKFGSQESPMGEVPKVPQRILCVYVPQFGRVYFYLKDAIFLTCVSKVIGTSTSSFM